MGVVEPVPVSVNLGRVGGEALLDAGQDARHLVAVGQAVAVRVLRRVSTAPGVLRDAPEDLRQLLGRRDGVGLAAGGCRDAAELLIPACAAYAVKRGS